MPPPFSAQAPKSLKEKVIQKRQESVEKDRKRTKLDLEAARKPTVGAYTDPVKSMINAAESIQAVTLLERVRTDSVARASSSGTEAD